MLAIEPWIPFIVATMLFACMPGPAILYMTAQTLAHGRKAGVMAALGIHVGCYVHIIAAAVGLAAILEHLPGLYAAIRLLGAAYLVWLGVSMLLGRAQAGDHAIAGNGRAIFRQSVVVEMLNPKTALFFLTFLPQFVNPLAGMPVGLQFLGLGMIVNLALSMADLAAVGLASLVSRHLLRHGAGNRVLPAVSGSVLIGLGVMLVWPPM
ncbi:LysE family translocator [Devosia sp. ZW T5_3]|uniref:LysE family translocator n=1 Tax=Devosia sp. ZW T5_3 TaxID=3378085 RepID=UPI00385191BF